MATFLITYYFCHTNEFAVLSHIQNRTLKVYLLVIPGHITISCVTLPKWLSFPIIKNYIDWHLSKHCLCVSWAEQLSVSRHIHVFKLFLLRKKTCTYQMKTNTLFCKQILRQNWKECMTKNCNTWQCEDP